MDKNYEEISDKEVFKSIEEGEAILRLEENEDFRLLKEAWKRLSEMALDQLIKTDAKETALIQELQVVIKFYRNVLGSTTDFIKHQSQLAFEEAKGRDLIKPEENP